MMDAFGVRFSVNDAASFQSLRSIFAELKRCKEADEFPTPEQWARLVPDDVKTRFAWPTPEERSHWLAIRDSTPITIRAPSQQLGSTWDFYRVFEAVEDGEYRLLRCEMIADGVAEMQIEPNAYPYGGLGPFIALAEAFGFTVLGVNECGNYESREDLLAVPRIVKWWRKWRRK